MSEARPLGGGRRAALTLAVLGLLALATASGVVTYRRKRLCLSQDGEKLASRERAGDGGEAIVVRAVDTGAELRRILSPPGRYALCLRMSDEGDLVMVEYEGVVEVWDVPP